MKSRIRMNHNKYDEWIYSAPTMDEVIKWLKKINYEKFYR